MLLDNLIILYDTREKSNESILEYFDEQGIKYEKRALKTGDYSFKIQACEELGIHRDMYYSDVLCRERKNSVAGIAGNY